MKVNENWLIKENALDVAKMACDLIKKIARESISKNNSFSIVLAGGTTPERIYSLLANENCNWNKWHIYLGDERCYAIDHPERNSTMIRQNFLDKVKIHEGNIHLIPAELGAKQAAKLYDIQINKVIPFDLVLLGMGEDGHTASLFPNQAHLDHSYVKAIYDAPKQPRERVSLTTKALSNNRNLLIIVTGSSKKEAIKQWKEGEELPVSNITSKGFKTILLDKDAFS